MTDLKVYIHPTAAQADPAGGIGQVILAQVEHLPEFGIQVIDDPAGADIIAPHVTGKGVPRVDVLHCHGLYWQDIPHSPFSAWHHNANKAIIEAVRSAQLVSVPSRWVAYPFQRDLRFTPEVIPHGIDVRKWRNGRDRYRPFVLWNKNRDGDVCDPTPALRLAEAGVRVISTFPPKGHAGQLPERLEICGTLPHSAMKPLIEAATIYLATTMETFGVGTLEALAAGVPVVGFDWGGTADIVTPECGVLVKPNDTRGMLEAVQEVLGRWEEFSEGARARAEQFTWRAAAEKYAGMYRRAHELKAAESDAVTVVVTNYNYERWVGEAVDSALAAIRPGDQIIIVDDGSTDGSREILKKYRNRPRVRIVEQENAGVAEARNAGARLATTPFLTFLDADDQLHPDFIRTVAPKLLARRGAGVAFVGLDFYAEDGQPMGNWEAKGFSWAFQSSPADPGTPPRTNIPTPSACMVRREMWERSGGYYQQYAPGEDTEFMVRGLSVGFEALPVPEDVRTRYRYHSGSASKTRQYVPIHGWHPWMTDRFYPMGAPVEGAPIVQSYARPLVSVIIPVGKEHAMKVLQALDSLLGQSFRSWEVLLIDDTGTQSAMPFSLLERTYPFAPVYRRRGRPGVGAARNTGLELARGELVLFLDADDFLAPDALQRMVIEYSKSEGRYIYGDAMGVLPDGTFERLAFNPYNPREILKQSHPVTVLISRVQALRLRFSESLAYYEDWDFFCRCAVAGYHGKHLGGHPVLYIRPGGISGGVPVEKRDAYAQAIIQAYAPYVNGDKAMGSCCPGTGGTEVMEAKLRLGLVEGPAAAVLIGGSMSGDGWVRMEFIGQEKAPIPYRGVDTRRAYAGADDILNKFADVHPDDVETLVRTGKWKVVRGASMAPPTPADTVLPAVETPIDWDRLSGAVSSAPATESPAGSGPSGGSGEKVPASSKPAPKPKKPKGKAAKVPEGMEPAISMAGTVETGSEISGMSAKAALAAIEQTTDRNTLLAWLGVEQDGKNRPAVLAAIEAKI